MDLSRRQFLQAGALLGASVILSPVVSLAAQTRRQHVLRESDIEGTITLENPPKYGGIRVMGYMGQMSPEEYISQLGKRYKNRDLTHEDYGSYSGYFDRDPNTQWFISEPGTPYRELSYNNFIEPTESEQRDYEKFIAFFEKNSYSWGLFTDIYRRFQEKTFRRQPTKLEEETLMHPAVLLSGRMGQGICRDRALALSAIYRRFGFEIKLPHGINVEEGKNKGIGHIWCRAFTQEGSFVDLDANYERFTLVRREN